MVENRAIEALIVALRLKCREVQLLVDGEKGLHGMNKDGELVSMSPGSYPDSILPVMPLLCLHESVSTAVFCSRRKPCLLGL